jgi:excisionase family DNA binding protein
VAQKRAAEVVELFTIEEAAKRQKCSEMHVYRQIARGDLRAVDIASPGAGRLHRPQDPRPGILTDARKANPPAADRGATDGRGQRHICAHGTAPALHLPASHPPDRVQGAG